ncbi:hypothetical protein BDB00DRAFT_866924 [Zychaea mexicana]|uniref:uncharacterized protein n=1 Tax=Zychaea mexicana TaxID=64656 RepID=UPI0022FE2997|nr:uncharacterized protein BDB00DRAFT_866924 [Zychaea mexicana]KAI9498852.1 hypothetical protein BDB00DRAFT_866924 [Zychaea mexicana]
MKIASITAAISLLAVATSALPHGGYNTNVGGSNVDGHVSGVLTNAAKGGVLASNDRNSDTTVINGHHKRGFSDTNVGGSNGEGSVSGVATNLLKGGVIASNDKNSGTTVVGGGYQGQHVRRWSDTNVGGSNTEGHVSGVLTNVAEGGVLASNDKNSRTNVAHQRRSSDVNVGGNNGEGHVSGVATNLAKGGVLASNDRNAEATAVAGHGHYKRGHSDVNVGGSNGEGHVSGVATNLAKGGVLASNDRNADTTVIAGQGHYKRGHSDVNVGGNNGEGHVSGVATNLAKGGVLASNDRNADTTVIAGQGHYKRGHSDVNVGGNNGEGHVSGVATNLAKGGVLASNDRNADTTVIAGQGHYKRGHSDVNVGGNNGEGHVSGVATNLAKGGVLASNDRNADTTVITGQGHYKRGHSDVNVGGNNGEGHVSGVATNLAKGGVLASNDKNADTTVITGQGHYKRGHSDVNVAGSNYEGHVSGVATNLAKGGVLASNDKNSNTEVVEETNSSGHFTKLLIPRTACFRCRSIRHSCDRKNPCSRCKLKGLSCSYPEHAPTLKQLQELTTALSNRVHYFQGLIRHRPHPPLEQQLTHQNNVFPCQKCYQSLQPCDMTLPRCKRCQQNGVTCAYDYDEKPKIYHIATAVAKLNAMMDKYEQALRREEKKRQRKAIWTVMSSRQGYTGVAYIASYNDLLKLIDHIAQVNQSPMMIMMDVAHKKNRLDECPFAVWDAWAYPTHPAMPSDYPIEITEQLTSDLLDLYCRTPCCSAIRLPIIDTEEFMARYKSGRAARVLVYAICAMTARNAFQVHVWNKKTNSGGGSGDGSQYNMGKALSVAYCLQARELLADCFDEPSPDTCRAAILLSYCSYQNGYPGLISYYEWIAVSMAHDLGLYDGSLSLSPYDNMLAWSLYYFHIWSQLLRGGSARLGDGWNSPPLQLLQPPQKTHRDYYLLSTWAFKFQLQTQRDAVMACILSAQQQGLSAQELADMLQPREKQLDNFYNQELPWEFKQDLSGQLHRHHHHHNNSSEHGRYTADVDMFARACILLVQVEFNINKILLHYPFLTMPATTTTSKGRRDSHFGICMHAAYSITCAIEASANYCNSPLIGLVFANSVYHKFWRYTNSQLALRYLKRSVDICKSTTVYAYDFEMAKTLVKIMESHVEVACSDGMDKDRQ